MRPHPKIRKTIKWGGAAASVVLAAAWVVSAWCAVVWQSANGPYACLHRGCIGIGWFDPAAPNQRAGFDVSPHAAPSGESGVGGAGVDWSSFSFRVPYGWARLTPLWMPAVPLLLITLVAWRLDVLARRRELVGKCARCGYDRAGLVAGVVCPECGAK